jgi:hypothetical protein
MLALAKNHKPNERNQAVKEGYLTSSMQMSPTDTV